MDLMVALIKALEAQRSCDLVEADSLYDLALESSPSEPHIHHKKGQIILHRSCICGTPEHFRKSLKVYSVIDRIWLSCINTLTEMDPLNEACDPMQQSIEKCVQTAILNKANTSSQSANEL